MPTNKTKLNMPLKRKTKRFIFALLMVALPVIQFSILYIYKNLNSILLAFQTYQPNYNSIGYDVSFAGFENFQAAFSILFSSNGFNMIKNSLILYVCNLVIVLGLALVFSYYISKKYLCSSLFRIVLFLPQIISGVVLAILYRFVVSDVFLNITKTITGLKPVLSLLDDPNTQYVTVLIYCIWIGFGTNVMIFTNAMSSINASLLESAQLDGVNIVQEFIYIYFPMIFPTFITFIVTGMAAVFTDQMNMYSFFGTTGANFFDVFGFYLYREAETAAVAGTKITYSTLSALGLIITMIVAPLTLFVRKLLEKYGPNVD